MASKIFKPRRGKKSTMAGTKANTVLASGEFFIEVPDAGAGTGNGKLKIGDGATTYDDLPYAFGDFENYSEIPISTITGTNASSILSSNVISDKPLKTLLSGLKAAILAQDTQITNLQSTFSGYQTIKSGIASSSLGASLGITASRFATMASNINNITVRSRSSTTLSAGGSTTVSAGYYANSSTVSASSLSSQTSGTATASRILSGYTAWVNGSRITGTYTAPSATTPTFRIYHRWSAYDGIALYVGRHSSLYLSASYLPSGVTFRYYYQSSLTTDNCSADSASGTLIAESSSTSYSISVSAYNYVCIRAYNSSQGNKFYVGDARATVYLYA